MAIGRLSFPHGLAVSNLDTTQIVQDNLDKVSFLSPGRNVYDYRLAVNEDGTAVLRMLPKYPDSGSFLLSKEGPSRPEIGERTTTLPQDQEIFEIIFHLS